MLRCPECKSTKLVKHGIVWSGRTKKQAYKCNDCGLITVRPIQEDVSNE